MIPADKLVYTDELCRKIQLQIKTLGSAEIVLCKMFAPPCSYKTARQYSTVVAHCFGMTAEEFMEEYRKLQPVARQMLNAASKASETDAKTSGESGSS